MRSWAASAALVLAFTTGVAAGTVSVTDSAGLVAAVQAAESGDVISLAAGQYTVSSTLSLSGKSDITITTADPLGATIARSPAPADTLIYRLFHLVGSTNIALNNLHLTGLTDADDGGLIRLEDGSSITVTGCALTDAQAETGAGIWAEGSTVTATDTVFNHLTGLANFGGAVHADQESKLLLNKCAFDSNTCMKGGAVAVENDSEITATQTAFTNNVATETGGALYVQAGAHGAVTECIFNHNSATHPTEEHHGEGGAIELIEGATLAVDKCIFDSNSAAVMGGAICVKFFAKLTLKDTIFTANTAEDGGAINLEMGQPVSLDGATFKDHTVTKEGACPAIHLSDADSAECADAAGTAVVVCTEDEATNACANDFTAAPVAPTFAAPTSRTGAGTGTTTRTSGAAGPTSGAAGPTSGAEGPTTTVNTASTGNDSPTLPPAEDEEESSGGGMIGMLIGIIATVLCCCIILAVLARRRKKDQAENQQMR